MNVLEIVKVKHGPNPGWLDFILKVDWEDQRGVREIEFTYNPDDTAPLTVGLRDYVVPTLDPSIVLPAETNFG